MDNHIVDANKKVPDIKPCPFCASEAKIFKQEGMDYKPWTAICQNAYCGCNARIPYCDSEEEAIAQWNKRTPDVEKISAERDDWRDISYKRDAELANARVNVGKADRECNAAIARAEKAEGIIQSLREKLTPEIIEHIPNLITALKRIDKLESDNNLLRESLMELLSAMERYEMDVDELPPKRHAEMMRKARNILKEGAK